MYRQTIRIYLSGRNYSRVDEQVFGTVSTNDTLSCTLPRWTSSNFFHSFSILRTSFTFRQATKSVFDFRISSPIDFSPREQLHGVGFAGIFPTDTLSRPIFHGSYICSNAMIFPFPEFGRSDFEGRAFDFFHPLPFQFYSRPKSYALLLISLEVISSATSQFA